MVYGCGCLVMVGITLTLIWAAVVLTNPYSLALLIVLGFISAYRQNTRKREKK